MKKAVNADVERKRSNELLQQGRGWKNWLSANQSGRERGVGSWGTSRGRWKALERIKKSKILP